jgi:hypothetical protein
MTVISFAEFGVCILAALVGVIWFEFYKAHLNREVAFPRTDYGHAF